MAIDVCAVNGADYISEVWVQFCCLSDLRWCWSVCVGEPDVSGIDWVGGECNENSFEISERNIEHA